MRSVVQQFKKLVAENKKEEAEKSLRQVYKKLDKLAKTDFLKQGKANRLKSRLAKKLSVK